MKKIIKWFTESNRYIHFFGGVIILLAMFAYSYPAGIGFLQALILVTIATFISAVFIELKDKQAGGGIDWRDILAQMAMSIIVWLCYIITYIAKLIL